MKKLTLILSMMIALIGINANAAVYIVGDAPFAGWHTNTGTPMVENADGTWSYTATIENKNVYFSFCDGFTENDGDWSNFVQFRYGPTADGQNVTSDGNWVATQHAGNAYKFYGNGEYVFTFDYNGGSPRFKVEGYVPTVEITTYTVTSDLDNWSGNNADYDMTLANGVYTWSGQNIELTAGTFEYKVVGNHDWGFEWPQGYGNNFTEEVAKHGYYNITITFDPATGESVCELTLVQEIEDPIIENHTYTVAGNNTTLFGSEWDPTDTNNDMTLANGLYTWTKEDVELTAGTIEFKVVMDHDWNNGANAWPSENYVGYIESNGNYDVKITFNEETKEIVFTATPVVVTEDFYTVAGAPEAIFGAEWSPSYAANNMTLVEGLYTWTKEDVELTAGTAIEFKVVKNGAWTNPSYPADNYIINIAEDGTYDLVITYNPENDEVIGVANKQGGEPVEMVYTVVGPEAIFGTNWDATDANNDMVLNAETGLYTWTADSVELTTAGFGFKVVGNHDWANEWPQGYDNNWIVNIAENGMYNLVITFNAETGEINCVATLVEGGEPTEITAYTVVGPEAIFGTDWDATDTNNDMVLAEGVYTWNKENVELNGSFGFKVVGNHDYAVYEWPMGFDNNWVAYVEEPGIYNIAITFDPEAADSARIACTLTKVEAIEMVYTVAGPEAVFGTDWDVTDTNNDMVLDEATGLYTWTKNGVDLTESFGFKVVGNHTWANEWPQGYDNNWIVNIEEAGKYDLVITFNAQTGEINCTATKVVEPAFELGDVNHSYGVDIEDVTLLINKVLGSTPDNFFPEQANCNGDAAGSIDIEDVTALINRVLSGTW
jgi:hypothetical protein